MNDGSISIQDIRRGMLIWECESGKDVCLLAVADATREDEGWTVQARIILSRRHDQVGNYQKLYQRDTAGAYGLRLYTSPQYTNPPMFELLNNISTVVADEWKIAQHHLARIEQAAREDMNALDRIASLAQEAHNSPGIENLLDLILNLASASSARAALEGEAK